MRGKIFLYKEKSNDRDCVVYIDVKPTEFVCGHYFSSPSPQGSCYSGGDFADYKDIVTVLTEAEYNQFLKFVEDIGALGYCIKEGDERYVKGIELCKAIQPVYNRLLSKENEELFEKIWEEEKEFLMDEYSLDESDIELIFDEYGLDYRDRSVVGCVYKDTYDLGEDEAWSIGIIDSHMKDLGFPYDRYLDYEKFGEDLVNDDERYIELEDGRVVCVNY